MNTAPDRGSDTAFAWQRYGAHGVLIVVPASLVLWALIGALVL